MKQTLGCEFRRPYFFFSLLSRHELSQVAADFNRDEFRWRV